MNIAMFTNTYLPLVGGVEQSIATFGEAFRKWGHPCLVVTPAMEGFEESNDEELRLPAIKRIGGSHFSMHIPMPGIIGPALDAFRPDIVHSHHPFLLGDLALRQARQRGVPLVLTYHTLWERYADSFGTEGIMNRVIQLTVEYSNVCDHVIAPSESIEKFLRELGVTTPTSVIPTGIDTAFFGSGDRQRGRRMLGIHEDDRVIGYVGRVGPEKNLLFLANAAAQWCRRDPSGRLLIVGKGQPEYMETLQDAFTQLGVGDRITLAGVRKGLELVDAYAAMDCFAFASLSETQGIVLAEAMAAGLPVLAIDAPGAREAVTDGFNGRLLPEGCDEATYTAAIPHLFRNPEERSRWQQNARERAQYYSRDATADRMLRLYESLITEYRRVQDNDGGFTAWDALRGRLEAEWELLETKLSAAVTGGGK